MHYPHRVSKKHRKKKIGFRARMLSMHRTEAPMHHFGPLI
jgi:hypothetical protein